MPRQARKKSSTGIYHIMIRGINKEKIFISSIYKDKILEILKGMGEELEYYIIAYCIMYNHMHMLIKIDEEKLETLMKKINIKYAMYYNKVEKRYGHVFQDRFRSEPVEDDNYLIGVLRYIHNNPIKAGIIKKIEDYKWSSASEYIRNDSSLVTEKYIKEVLSSFKNTEDFIRFHSQTDDNIYIDIKEEETENIKSIVNLAIENYINKIGIEDQSQITTEQKEELAKILLKLEIISYRDVAEICNLSYYKVVEIGREIKK